MVTGEFLLMALDTCVICKITAYNPVISQLSENYFGIDYTSNPFATMFHNFLVKTFSTNVPLLFLLKTSENLRFSAVFRGYKSGTLIEYGLIRKKVIIAVNLVAFG